VNGTAFSKAEQKLRQLGYIRRDPRKHSASRE
jgi:hypothetical protein